MDIDPPHVFPPQQQQHRRVILGGSSNLVKRPRPFPVAEDDCEEVAEFLTRTESATSWGGTGSSRASPLAREAGALMDTLKRIRISRPLPGQLRLASDVNELRKQTWMAAFPTIELDENNDSILYVHGPNARYCVLVDKRYPHVPPLVTTTDMSTPVPLEILYPKNWTCIFSLVDVFRELLFGPVHSGGSGGDNTNNNDVMETDDGL